MFKLIFVLLFICGQSAFGQIAQRSVLYEGSNSGGQYIIIPQTYVPNLAQYNFDNKARSVCVTGTWLFYVNTDFNTYQNGGMEYVFGPNNYCTNLQSIGGYVSSARFVGAPNDYRTDTFTLFQGDYFQGAEEYTFVDLPYLNLLGNHKSIVITGQSAWTVYDQPSYGGNSICLYPEPSADYKPYFIPDVTSVSIPHGTIKSIRKGCAGKTNNNVAEFARAASSNSSATV